MSPHICPVCEGRQSVSRFLYEEMPEPAYRPEPENIPRVPCRSCQATGVVWPVSSEQRANLDLVTGFTATVTLSDPELWCGLDPTAFVVDPEPEVVTTPTWPQGGLALGTVDLKPSQNVLVYHAVAGSEFSLKDCHIEVGDAGGGINIVGDLDSVRTTIEGNFIERVEGLQGIRIYPRVPDVHPERKRVLDLLATLPEDMPLLVLTPQSVVEIDTAKDYRGRMQGGSVQQRGVEALVARMNDYQGSRNKYPPEVSPRLAGLPVTEGDE